jgi:hypothetical protein
MYTAPEWGYLTVYFVRRLTIESYLIPVNTWRYGPVRTHRSRVYHIVAPSPRGVVRALFLKIKHLNKNFFYILFAKSITIIRRHKMATHLYK